MGRKKVHRTIHGRDVGKEVRVRFRMGTGGRGTKWYVCVMGDGRENVNMAEWGDINYGTHAKLENISYGQTVASKEQCQCTGSRDGRHGGLG